MLSTDMDLDLKLMTGGYFIGGRCAPLSVSPGH